MKDACFSLSIFFDNNIFIANIVYYWGEWVAPKKKKKETHSITFLMITRFIALL